MKRKFYIIAHNPNSVAEALQALRDGANSLEPDVHCTNGKLYVGEKSSGTKLPLEDYLGGLKTSIPANNAINLSLIAFDIKDNSCPVTNLLASIRQLFSDSFPGLTILITRSSLGDDEKNFFNAAQGILRDNEWLGVDQSTTATDVNDFFRNAGIKNFTYGNGISVPLIPTTIYKKKIQEAIALRDAGNSFSMVYAWTVNAKSSMRTYINMGVNGLITDNPARLKDLLANEYPGTYDFS